MTDTELLELAAKAVGYKDWVDFSEVVGEPTLSIRDDGAPGMWSPLTDDGDALRLAVKLNLLLGPEFSNYLSLERFAHQEQDDAFATRRAIVRAAAEIGKGVK